VLGRAAEDGTHGVSTEGAAADIAVLEVGFDVSWQLPNDDIGAFVDWVNERFELDSESSYRVSVERLRQGTVVDGWRYEPPSPLDSFFDRLRLGRDPAHIGLEGLAWALLSGEDLAFHQPDDDHRTVAWRAGGTTADR